MKAIRYTLLCLAVAFSAHLCGAQDKDAKGCKDSPLISRFPGSYITSCTDTAAGGFDFTVTVDNKQTPKHIGGELHQVQYSWPATASKSEVVRNLNIALKKAGYTFDYDSGDYGDFTVHMGKTWIMEEVSSGHWYRQTMMVDKELPNLVVVTAAALSTSLTGAGHTVVSGIFFDTGKSDVKPDSDPALQQVAKMLKSKPTLKVYVVGHTDNVGGVAGNVDLSKRRAAAVVLLLTTKYGVAPAQLQPYGNGPYAPIASNASEDGRALNRRVELVEQ